ncbi:hypothetical protein B484DRAFT_452088 [Ochromonadaceae sp. CCMP2298]|nr:hypothetical protein B484DRAFT_452088 [Ochromonadaceae sp. CCMP2298]
MLEPAYLPGTTYWVNDYLHVGHVHYDIALLAVLQAVKVDRIVLQRASCHGSLCAGVGTVDSFYKGYWTALLAAAGQLNVPVYIRFSFREKHVIPLYFSLESEDYFDSTRMHTKPSSTPILLHNWMVFERLVRRSELHYGSIGAVSAEAVQLFKKAAYSLIRPQPQEPHITTQPQPPQAPQTSLPLRTYFEAEGPFKILISYRGPQATRHMANMELLVGKLQRALPPPLYALRLLNSSDPLLTFQTQLQAVAESHVVICNHGAFEANMIYMRNGSLLLEVFGEYGNNEVHTFQRLAVMFGLLYERVNIRSLGDHQTKDFNVTDAEAEGIVGVLERYFLNKPYLRNLAS